MDHKIDNILRDLGNYCQEVPKELSDDLFSKIEAEKKAAPLEYTLRNLKEHETTPAENSFSSIRQKISGPSLGAIHFRRYAAAAAVLAILLTGTWLLFKQPGEATNKETVSNKLPAKVIPVDKKNKPAEEIAGTTEKKKIQPANETHSPVKKLKPVTDYFSEAEKKEITATGPDNPLFFAFARYIYSQGGTSIPKDTNPLKLHLDKYSSANIPERMVRFMQTTRKTNKKGKPTAKARKTLKRIQKIRKKDAEFFKSNKHNPTDIIDLGNFIFDK